MRRIRASVPRAASRRALVLALVDRLVEVVLGERWDLVEVTERRDGAAPDAVHRRSAELGGALVGRAVGESWIVAGRARHLSRGRQLGVEEEAAPELGHGRSGGRAAESRRIEGDRAVRPEHGACRSRGGCGQGGGGAGRRRVGRGESARSAPIAACRQRGERERKAGRPENPHGSSSFGRSRRGAPGRWQREKAFPRVGRGRARARRR